VGLSPSTWAAACWPISAIRGAGEHDAERAVRAALKLVEKVAGLDTVAAATLQVRVGIATGLVVVGI
jgi:class 3 adenylate cyclase